MTRGAQRAGRLGGAALISVALLMGAAPATAVAASVPPSSGSTTSPGTSASTGPGGASHQQIDAEDPDGFDAAEDLSPGSSEDPTSDQPTPPVAPLDESGTSPVEPAPDPTDTPEPGSAQPTPTQPTPTQPTPTPPAPTVPAQPEPADPEPTVPEPTVPEPTVPEPAVPEPTVPEPAVPELTEPPEQSVPTYPISPEGPASPPAAAEHYLLCGSVFAAPGQTQSLRLQMSRGLSDLTVGSSLTGATVWIEGGIVYYQAPSPLPPGSSQDDFAVRAIAPNGEPVSDRCNIGLQASSSQTEEAEQPTLPGDAGGADDVEAAERAGSAEDAGDARADPATPRPGTSGSSETSAGTRSGPPIPGMPGYSLPEPGSPGPSASASPSEQVEDAEPASQDAELAATGLRTGPTVAAVALALMAIVTGAAAMVLAGRRSDWLR